METWNWNRRNTNCFVDLELTHALRCRTAVWINQYSNWLRSSWTTPKRKKETYKSAAAKVWASLELISLSLGSHMSHVLNERRHIQSTFKEMKFRVETGIVDEHPARRKMCYNKVIKKIEVEIPLDTEKREWPKEEDWKKKKERIYLMWVQ